MKFGSGFHYIFSTFAEQLTSSKIIVDVEMINNILPCIDNSVKEVVSGHECGLTVEKYNDIKVGDVIEAYGNIEVARD